MLGRAIPSGAGAGFRAADHLSGDDRADAAHAGPYAAALVSIIASLVFAFLPTGMGLFIAAPLAMLTGAGVEIWMERRREAQACDRLFRT